MFSKYLLKFFILLILITLSGFCKSKKKKIPELPDATNESIYVQKWKKYGAYYDKDEMIYTTVFHTSGCVTKFEVYKKIKTLTTEGTEYGTVPVTRLATRISSFEPHLYNANGVEVPLDEDKLRKEYLESGKVVFPKVTAGCVITLRIVFLDKNLYYLSDWYEFSRPLPVRIGRFTHIFSRNSVYDYKISGKRQKYTTETYKKGRAKAWIIKDLEPQKDLDYLDYDTKTEPKIVVKILNIKTWNRNHNSREEIFDRYENECNTLGMHIARDPLFSGKLKELTSFTKDPLKRARKILWWVQNNMTSIGYGHDVCHNILESRKASYLQIACLCHKLFTRARLESEIVLTFSQNDFILDTTFLFYARYIITAMPVVYINGKTYVTYPYLKGYELGEYPLSYNGAICINPAEETIAPLPPPLHGEKWIKDRIVLDLSSFPGKYTLIREYRKNSASSYRNGFLNMDKEKQREKFEDLLKAYSETNKIESLSFTNLKKYEKPLLATVTFTSDETPIPYENKKIFKLNSFFYDYFDDITPDRTEDVFIHNPATYIDEIEILKIPGKKITNDIINIAKEAYYGTENAKKEGSKIEFKKVKRGFIDIEYSSSETDTSYIIKRTITYNIIRIPREHLKKIYDDCVKLNTIKNSTITISEK